ncbi:MAG: glycosyltransferase, partial [Verrucomicrobium sp.]
HEAIRNCRAMLAPSVWWEPLGLVTYEAYDYGKPMLAARSGGLSETVIPGLTGFLHEPGDAPALAGDVMIIESMSAQERQDMGAAGRSWLLSECSPPRWKMEFDNILTQALSR